MELINDFSTVPTLLRNVVAHIHKPSNTFLMHKKDQKWQEYSFEATLKNADAVSAFLLNQQIQKGDRIGLMLENCPDYVFFDQGVQQIGAVNVSIYPTLAESEMQYIINDSGMKMILVGNPFLLKKVLKVANQCPDLKVIIKNFPDDPKIEVPQVILDFSKVIAVGNSVLSEYQLKIKSYREAILPNDLSSLIYTSGTTGIPKGVMLSHQNFVQNVKECLKQIPVINNHETFLSFLPLSHVFERTATYHVCCAMGCKIAFAQSLELLAKNMTEVKPTVMSAVPRLLERIHDKAMKSGTEAGGMKSKIFTWALATGQQYRQVTEAGKSPNPLLKLQQKLADKLVFSKIKEKTGGRLKFMISGGAALPKNVGEFFGNLGIKVLEGFGLTETSPVVAVTEYHRQIYGTVGRVIPGIEIGIQNIENKEFINIQSHDTFDPEWICEEGEIVIRGHCVMKGYWNKPDETAQVIDTNGWFHTGDIGRFFKGNLQITDRLKNMIVNAYGKNVYPTPIENTYLKSPKIEMVFLIGDKKEYITAIIIPNRETLQETFQLEQSFFDKPDAFIRDEKIINWLMKDIDKQSTELAKFERIKRILVKRNPFTIEDGEITPTLKAKRRIIEQKYQAEIEQLYQD